MYKFLITIVALGFANADLATIQANLNSVGGALQSLDTAILAVNGPQNAAPVLAASTNVNQVINMATMQIQGTTALSLGDALSLSQTGQQLATQANTTITDLVGKKDIIVAAGQAPTTLQALQQQKTASQALAAAVVAKVPGVAQGIVMQQTGQIAAAVDMGIVAFSNNGEAAPISAPGNGNGTVPIVSPPLASPTLPTLPDMPGVTPRPRPSNGTRAARRKWTAPLA